jgi:hypothetical protein
MWSVRCDSARCDVFLCVFCHFCANFKTPWSFICKVHGSNLILDTNYTKLIRFIFLSPSRQLSYIRPLSFFLVTIIRQSVKRNLSYWYY